MIRVSVLKQAATILKLWHDRKNNNNNNNNNNKEEEEEIKIKTNKQTNKQNETKNNAKRLFPEVQ